MVRYIEGSGIGLSGQTGAGCLLYLNNGTGYFSAADPLAHPWMALWEWSRVQAIADFK